MAGHTASKVLGEGKRTHHIEVRGELAVALRDEVVIDGAISGFADVIRLVALLFVVLLGGLRGEFHVLILHQEDKAGHCACSREFGGYHVGSHTFRPGSGGCLSAHSIHDGPAYRLRCGSAGYGASGLQFAVVGYHCGAQSARIVAQQDFSGGCLVIVEMLIAFYGGFYHTPVRLDEFHESGHRRH